MTSPVDAALHLTRPEGGRWQLRSTRAEWATALLRGRPAAHAPTLLPGLYALCGGAHRLAARHALAAAQAPREAHPQGRASDHGADAQALRLDTLREHLRRLWLDAPRLAADEWRAQTAPTAADLGRATFMHADADLLEASMELAARRWVEANVLQQDAEAWVAAWQRDPATHARQWATAAGTWPARWLGAMHRLLGERAVPCRAAHGVATEPGLQTLAHALRTQLHFALSPTEGGLPAETGCWARLAGASRPSPASAAASALPLWLRHAARIAEVARLVAAGGAGWLAQGRFTPAEAPSAERGWPDGGRREPAEPRALREGLGWCEMARGLLVHWVCLDADERIVAYRVLAPTEWNFHAEGGAARALVACLERSGAAGVDMAQLLATAAAYDPCVELRVEQAVRERSDA